MTLELSESHGKIHHIIPREKVVANTLWEAYQLEAVVLGGSLFQRRPIKTVSHPFKARWRLMERRTPVCLRDPGHACLR